MRIPTSKCCCRCLHLWPLAFSSGRCACIDRFVQNSVEVVDVWIHTVADRLKFLNRRALSITYCLIYICRLYVALLNKTDI
jgi:hypothetical protein